MGYVLVNENDIVVTASIVVEKVQELGVKAAAELYGVSEGRLRQFLNQNGWRGKRSTVWEQQPLDGVTEEIPQVPVPASDDEVPF